MVENSETFQNLVNEGQEFLKLRKAFKRANNPAKGTPGYLVSKPWVDRYKLYVHYDELKNNRAPEQESHQHPGRISNEDFLETDTSIFLPGTGSLKDQHFCSEVADRYVKESATETKDYEVINEAIWEFL